LPKKA